MTTPVLEIGKKLKEIRTSRQLSLSHLAALTEVSKPMLGQIERGQSVPTITTLWKIATSLKVPLSSFLEEAQADYTVMELQTEEITVQDEGRMRMYPLSAYDPVRGMELFYSELDAGCHFLSDAHNAGVEEYLFVLSGALQVVLDGKEVTVKAKQALRFRADSPHAYQNPFEEACSVFNMIFYPRH